MGRDSFLGTLLVALGVCVVCSVLVSSAAVFLYPKQEANAALYEKRNILKVAGLVKSKDTTAPEEGPTETALVDPTPEQIEELFKARVRKVLVDLDTGDIVSEEKVDYAQYNPRDAANNPKQSEAIPNDIGPTPGVDRRPKMQFVYEVLSEGSSPKVEQYVLPVYGKGLWSTMYGFLALDSDGKTIRGITFYDQGETPGLGGEVENKKWQQSWDGKLAYNDEEKVIIQVVKGTATPEDAAWTIDGLSGATITTKGVSNLVQYWLGPDGFEPFLKKQTGGNSST